MENTESSHLDLTPNTRDPNWDRDHLRAKRCRSPRQSDLHHLSQEFPAVPPISSKRHDSTVIEIHQRVLSFRLSLDLIPNASPHLLSYRVVLNPQLRDPQETLRENCRQENLRRRANQGCASHPPSTISYP